MRHAIVAIVERGDRLLMVQRGGGRPFQGWWTPLSGRIEPGETQAQAVVREVLEEVGLEVRPLRKVWECPADGADFILHWWTCELLGGELRPDLEELGDARWLTLEEIHALQPTFAGDRKFFEQVWPTLAVGE